MPAPILRNVANDDLSARFQSTAAVTGSPALAAETIIATLTLADFGNLAVTSGVRLHGWASFTVGTSGDGATWRIRQTDASGSVVAASGKLTVTAADLVAGDILGFDAAPGIGKYVLTLQINSGGAVSTVSAANLSATII